MKNTPPSPLVLDWRTPLIIAVVLVAMSSSILLSDAPVSSGSERRPQAAGGTP